MTDAEVIALFADWYVVYAGRWPSADDFAYITAHWLPAWRADPLKARFDFGKAAEDEVGGKNVAPVRHFELPPATSGVIHRHRLAAGNPVVSVYTDPNDPPTV